MSAGDVAHLRAATTADLEELVAIEGRVFARPWSRASLRDELSRHDRVWLVAEVGGAVVGYGGVADLAGDAHVLTVAVAPGHRRRGHATALVAGLLRAARERFGAARATLEVRESNAGARALYRRCGFTEAGVRPGYYQDDGEGAVVLWCDDLAAAVAGDRADPRHPTSHPPTPPATAARSDQEERP